MGSGSEGACEGMSKVFWGVEDFRVSGFRGQGSCRGSTVQEYSALRVHQHQHALLVV